MSNFNFVRVNGNHYSNSSFSPILLNLDNISGIERFAGNTYLVVCGDYQYYVDHDSGQFLFQILGISL